MVYRKDLLTEVFDKSYVVRGAPAKADTCIRSWITPGDSTLDEFFGDSAKYWAPKCWKKLRDSTAVAVAAAGTSSNGTAPVWWHRPTKLATYYCIYTVLRFRWSRIRKYFHSMVLVMQIIMLFSYCFLGARMLELRCCSYVLISKFSFVSNVILVFSSIYCR
jgi:hypothetical protein